MAPELSPRACVSIDLDGHRHGDVSMHDEDVAARDSTSL
jgi:hypothetical protein